MMNPSRRKITVDGTEGDIPVDHGYRYVIFVPEFAAGGVNIKAVNTAGSTDDEMTLFAVGFEGKLDTFVAGFDALRFELVAPLSEVKVDLGLVKEVANPEGHV